MGYPQYQVSGDAQRALEQFSAELDGVLAAAPAETWATQFGVSHAGKWRTTYPIPLGAAGYVERRGDTKFRTLGERSVTFIPKEYVDGIEAHTDVIEAPDFVGWLGAPAQIAAETLRQPNLRVAEVLEANANLGFYLDRETGTDLGIALFAGTHPVNIFDTLQGTFDNDHTAAAINAAMFTAAFTRFATRKAPNGRSMNLRVTDMLCPPALEQTAKDFLESDSLLLSLSQGANAAAPLGFTNNRHKNAVNLIVVPELTSSSYVYLLAAAGPPAWIVQAPESPEEVVYDKTSEFWKNTRKVKMYYSIVSGAAGCLPHAIERIQITG